ncbi:Di-copper centre-containing protein [Aspergillus affinis]|uniref:Di-copper centre-containing protein n=1 Tax=Aspergillus affinis TaxID=1070780 RepID=UPI0022FE9986|nr:Di-copper centre-containing protein [Aspergillus affinis]KAI9037067.1 Di-copper centre-containing protein [Aspergillus affinis]
MQGMVATPGYLGVHSGGHYTVGGDPDGSFPAKFITNPGQDFFTSLGDPAFFLHHAAIDRLFWTWQNQDPAKRTYQVIGPTGFLTPDGASINATLDDIVDMGGFLAPPKTLRQLSGTMGGPFCYVYT